MITRRLFEFMLTLQCRCSRTNTIGNTIGATCGVASWTVENSIRQSASRKSQASLAAQVQHCYMSDVAPYDRSLFVVMLQRLLVSEHILEHPSLHVDIPRRIDVLDARLVFLFFESPLRTAEGNSENHMALWWGDSVSNIISQFFCKLTSPGRC